MYRLLLHFITHTYTPLCRCTGYCYTSSHTHTHHSVGVQVIVTLHHTHTHTPLCKCTGYCYNSSHTHTHTPLCKCTGYCYTSSHTHTHTPLCRTHLNGLSSRLRDPYLTRHDIDKRQLSMTWTGFEPEIAASERPQT